MPEWLMGADCKSAGNAYAGSNPARPKNKKKESSLPSKTNREKRSLLSLGSYRPLWEKQIISSSRLGREEDLSLFDEVVASL